MFLKGENMGILLNVLDGTIYTVRNCTLAKVNIKQQGPKNVAPFHLLLILENKNGYEM